MTRSNKWAAMAAVVLAFMSAGCASDKVGATAPGINPVGSWTRLVHPPARGWLTAALPSILPTPGTMKRIRP
jgi:hypothetical protein